MFFTFCHVTPIKLLFDSGFYDVGHHKAVLYCEVDQKIYMVLSLFLKLNILSSDYLNHLFLQGRSSSCLLRYFTDTITIFLPQSFLQNTVSSSHPALRSKQRLKAFESPTDKRNAVLMEDAY